MRIRMHPGFRDELATLGRSDRREANAIGHALHVLSEQGGRLGYPWTSAVRGKRGSGLRELRPRAGRSAHRVLYRVAPNRVDALALAPEAGNDQRGFAHAVEHARARAHAIDQETT